MQENTGVTAEQWPHLFKSRNLILGSPLYWLHWGQPGLCFQWNQMWAGINLRKPLVQAWSGKDVPGAWAALQAQWGGCGHERWCFHMLWVWETSPSAAMWPRRVFPQVFYTPSLLFPSEDETPASTTLSIQLSFHACWAPDEASRLIVMHRNDNGMQLIISTYELRAKKSREEVDILGKGPSAGPSRSMCPTLQYNTCSTGFSDSLWGILFSSQWNTQMMA